MDGPVWPSPNGLSCMTTRAVITFATLAVGICASLPESASLPRPDTPTAAEPVLGQGSEGAEPAMVFCETTEEVAATAGTGRKKFSPRAAATSTARPSRIRPRILKNIASAGGERDLAHGRHAGRPQSGALR